jgi:penicillin-binding protein 1A
MEIRYEKSEILRKYLNTLYLGNGLYGIASAGVGYFGQENLTNLSEDEQREIITRIKYPNLTPGYETYAKTLIEK